ncbi:MAG: LuxR C-terminal-related transcriptional regulator, partial [Candidatus Dormiibacterota bacterium]
SDGDGLCRRSEVELLLVEGRPHEAAEAADEYAARSRRVVNPGWAPWRSFKAQALDRLGRRDEALALLSEELAFARSWGAPGTVAQTLRVLGTMEGGDGLDHLREAVEVAAGSPARLEHGKALAALGTSLRHARRPTDAREPLRGALELATRFGAAPLADRARAELLAAGGRVRSRTLVGPGSLTPGERRVVDLAVEGRSNREIAQTLFITPKTVEVHLSSAYQKLGIRSRQQLGTALVDPA